MTEKIICGAVNDSRCLKLKQFDGRLFIVDPELRYYELPPEAISKLAAAIKEMEVAA